MNKTIALIILYISYSCTVKNKNEIISEEIKINVESDPIEFCELVDSVRIIDLETTEESIIAFLDHVEIVNDKIFIQDVQTQSLLIFNYPNGDFISKIDFHGNAPSEYSDLSDFNINPEKSEIEILDRNSKKLIKYDLNGKFIESKKIPFHADKFRYLNHGKHIVFSNYSQKEDNKLNYEIIVTNSNLEVEDKYIEISKFTSYLIKQDCQISKLQDKTISFLPKNSTDIYHIENKNIRHKYHINFGKNWDENVFYSKVDNPRWIVDLTNERNLVRGVSVRETNSKLLINFWLQNKYHIGLYDKVSKYIDLINPNKINSNRLFAKGVYNDSFLFVSNDQNEKIDCIPDKKEDCRIDSNPTLVIVKFK